MFNVVELRDTIKIIPQYFDQNYELAIDAVEAEILKKYANKVG
jgi:DNA-directed RNA polymerase subunit E'/Rpb7